MLLLISALCALLFLHPYVFYPLSLGLMPDRPLRRRAGAVPPSATLVFCAYNESASMPEKLANLRAIRALVPTIRFKAYVDESTDDTLAILRAHPDLIEVHAAPGRTGKALGMRKLASVTDTDIMIFTDANVTVQPESIPRLLDYFADPEVGGVCGTLVYVNPDESATAGVNSAYWRLEEYIKKGESRSSSTMGADGSIFATRRAYYPEVPAHLLDDFIVSMSIVFAGLRLVSAPDVIAYERAASGSGDEFRRKRRIACRAYSSHRYLVPRLRKMSWLNWYKYISHRMIRWYGASFLGIGALAAVVWTAQTFGLVTGGLFALVIAMILFGVLSMRGGKLAQLAEMVRAIWATGLGVADAWRGKRYQTWQPPQTR